MLLSIVDEAVQQLKPSNSCIEGDFSLHSDSQKRLRQLYLFAIQFPVI